MILVELERGISSYYYIIYTGYGTYYGDDDGIVDEMARMMSSMHHPACADSFIIKKIDNKTLEIRDASDREILKLTQRAMQKTCRIVFDYNKEAKR